MSIEWYRVYHGMPQDAKLKVIAHRTKQPMADVLAVWVCLLDIASQSNPRGNLLVDPEEIAVMQNLETENVKNIIEAFYVKNMITPEGRLAAWDKRQYTTSTERMQKHRDKKKQRVTRGDTAKRDVSPSNAKKRKNSKNKTDTDTENRLQKSEAECRAETESESEKDSDKKLRAREEKEEHEKEKHKSCGKDAEKKGIQDKKGGSQILEQMLDIWNAEVQSKLTKGQKASLTTARREQMTLRWLEDFQQDMQAWKYYCEIIGASDFCLGKIPGKSWTIDLSWAVESSEHVAKVLEGGFSGGNHPPRPPACHVPELQAAHNEVLREFEKRHGRAVCRSWLANTAITGMERHRDGATLTMCCPSKFSRDWITQHYLSELNGLWAETTANSARVTGLELVMEA